MKRRIILVGAGGSTKVIIDILNENTKNEIICILDDDMGKQNKIFCGYKIIGAIKDIVKMESNYDEAIICVGATKDIINRHKIFDYLTKNKITIGSLISDRAMLSPSVSLGTGVIILNGVIINADTNISDNVFLNTGTIVEHDCQIGKSSFLSPNVTLSGCVEVGEKCFIGTSSVAAGRVKIGENVTIGAGSVIVRDIPNSTISYGNPSHKNIRRK